MAVLVLAITVTSSTGDSEELVKCIIMTLTFEAQICRKYSTLPQQQSKTIGKIPLRFTVQKLNMGFGTSRPLRFLPTTEVLSDSQPVLSPQLKRLCTAE